LGLTQPNKYIVRSSPTQYETLNTPTHDQHYWTWFVDIMVGGPIAKTW